MQSCTLCADTNVIWINTNETIIINDCFLISKCYVVKAVCNTRSTASAFSCEASINKSAIDRKA